MEKPKSAFEEKMLSWVQCQLERQNPEWALTVADWKRIKLLDRRLDVFLDALALFPASNAVDAILCLIIDDLKHDFGRFFRLIKIGWEDRPDEMPEALKTCLSYSVRQASDQFAMIEFLSDKTDWAADFTSLSRQVIFGETKQLDKLGTLLGALMNNKDWELSLACAYRMIGIAENQGRTTEKAGVAAQLILCHINRNEPEPAGNAYKKYWMANSVDQPFPYAGPLVRSQHLIDPNSGIIAHVCRHLDAEKHQADLAAESPWAILLEAKRLEFEENWSEALQYWDKLLGISDPEWQLSTACFIANNGLKTKDHRIVEFFALPVLKGSADKRYQRIALSLQICATQGLSDMAALRELRREYGQGADLEKAELLPDEGQIFSEYLIPRVLEALFSMNHRAAFQNSLNLRVTRRRLPKYDRLFLTWLMRIDQQLAAQKQKFTPDELRELIFNFESALKIPVDDRKLLILAEKIVEADPFIPKDSFGVYEDIDCMHLGNVLVWLAAFRAEQLFEQNKTNLSLENRQRIKEKIRRLDLQSAAENLRNLTNLNSN